MPARDSPRPSAPKKRKQGWAKILDQSRAYSVPTADEFADEFHRRFGGGVAAGSTDRLLAYFNLPNKFTLKDLKRAYKKRFSRFTRPRRVRGGGAECVANFDALSSRC